MSTETGIGVENRTPTELSEPTPKKRWILPVLFSCLIVVLIVGLVWNWWIRTAAVSFTTPYQAVLLSNGAVYYGKLQGYGTAHPILTNVFYIVTNTNPETKQVTNVLVKRGKELHGPDRMYLNPNQIVFVETVAADSKLAQLISQAQ